VSGSATISVESPEHMFPVELLDTSGRKLARGYGRLALSIPAGDYVARCEVGGPAIDRMVTVVAGEASTVLFTKDDLPCLPSAAPVLSAVTRHEFYTEDAAALANQVLGNWNAQGTNLVLFASRFEYAKRPGSTRAKPVHWGELRLRAARGEVLVELPGEATRSESDRLVGRAGVALKQLQPGGYFLEWPSTDPKGTSVQLQPLWLSAGWTTLLFASALGESSTPRRETVSIQMARNESQILPYDPAQNYLNTAAELALASFRTGRRQLGDQALDLLLDGKFDNPMLGILGAYVLLRDQQADRALLSRVIRNLELLVGDHPDVLALRLLASGRTPVEEAPPKDSMLKFPPMVHVGLMGADALEWQEHGTLFSSPAYVDRMSAVTRLAKQRALPEGPWTAFWHPTKDPMLRPALSPSGTDPRLLVAPVPNAWHTVETFVGPHDIHSLIEKSFEGGGGKALVITPEPSSGALLYLVEDEPAPVEEAAQDSTLEATRALLGYLLGIRTRHGLEGLTKLSPEQLNWAGLSPRQVSDVVDLAMRNSPRPDQPPTGMGGN
jgi:hypothetical protein